MTVEGMQHQLYVGPSSDATDPNTLTGTFGTVIGTFNQ
jgi:hypothetical protein